MIHLKSNHLPIFNLKLTICNFLILFYCFNEVTYSSYTYIWIPTSPLKENGVALAVSFFVSSTISFFEWQKGGEGAAEI